MALTGIVLFPSCVNDMDEVNALVINDTTPTEIAYDIEVIHSDSGRIQAVMTSPHMIRYEVEESRTIFPDGIFVVFYDSVMNIRSDLRANHAVAYDETNIMEARGDVEVNNYKKQERINTEYMKWDQKTHMIYSNVFVKITTPDKTIYGEEGFEADEKMNQWVIKKPRGTFEVETEED